MKTILKKSFERIRNIRSNERSLYQKITDIYFSCSVDYDKNLEIIKEFSERNVRPMISFCEQFINDEKWQQFVVKCG